MTSGSPSFTLNQGKVSFLFIFLFFRALRKGFPYGYGKGFRMYTERVSEMSRKGFPNCHGKGFRIVMERVSVLSMERVLIEFFFFFKISLHGFYFLQSLLCFCLFIFL